VSVSIKSDWLAWLMISALVGFPFTTRRRGNECWQSWMRTQPKGYATWAGPRLAKALGNVSTHQVWRMLRQLGISLARRRSWCVSTDPEFAQKAADIVGLYLARRIIHRCWLWTNNPAFRLWNVSRAGYDCPDGCTL
jgi:hypothetical protein